MKNILRTLSKLNSTQQKVTFFSSPRALNLDSNMVRVKNGESVSKSDIEPTLKKLKKLELEFSHLGYLDELKQKCAAVGGRYKMNTNARQECSNLGLLRSDGSVPEYIRDIVLSSVEVNYSELKITSPLQEDSKSEHSVELKK